MFGCSKPLEPNYDASSPPTENCNYEKSKEESTDEIENKKFQLLHWKEKKRKKNGEMIVTDIQEKLLLIYIRMVKLSHIVSMYL